jgi:hypothetical protein
MNITTTPSIPTTPPPRFIVDRLADTPSPLLTSPPPAMPPKNRLTNHRDSRGRFVPGCRPGPGRPRKLIPRRFVPPLQLLQRGLDMDDTSKTWKIIVSRFGPKATKALLKNIEAEYGPICFRHLAIQAIAAAEENRLTGQRAPKLRARRLPVRSSPSGSRNRRSAAANPSPNGSHQPKRTK